MKFQNSCSSHGQVDERKKMGVPPVCPVDQQFLTWLRRCREQGRDVTAIELKNKARRMADQCTPQSCHWFKLWVSRLEVHRLLQSLLGDRLPTI